MASSRSVVPAMGLLGVTGGAGAGGEVRTAVSGAGSGTRSQHAPTSPGPSITSHPPPSYPCGLLDLRATPRPTPQPLPPTQSAEVLVSGRHLLLPTSTPPGISGSPHR